MSIWDRQKKPIEFDKEPIKPFGADMDFRELSVGGGSKLFKVNAEGLFMGADNYTDAPFKVSFAGAFTSTSATITGYVATGGAAADVNAGATTINGGKLTTGTVTADFVVASVSLTSPTISGGSIAIGSGNSIFKADSNGIYLGNATFASAPFRVTMAGAVTATSLTLTNASIGSGSSYTGNQIAEAYIGTLSASKISTSTLSAIAADLGTITAGSITGVTITGGTVQTATSGQRIVISSNVLSSYDASALRLKINANQLQTYDGSGVLAGHISGSTVGNSHYLQLSAVSDPNACTIILDQDTLTSSKNVIFNSTATGFLGIYPSGSGAYDLGNATNYWADVSYKTLTDRGCLSGCDDGVELQDGRIVSDTEAIKAIKKRDDNKKTVYGMPMLDYKTFPKMSYKPAQKKGETEGVEMTSMFSVMLGAIRELTNRIEQLEKKIT